MNKSKEYDLIRQIEQRDKRIAELEQEKKVLIQVLGREELRYQKLEAENQSTYIPKLDACGNHLIGDKTA